jgi:predicted benzoate:H+ symporter BenE
VCLVLTVVCNHYRRLISRLPLACPRSLFPALVRALSHLLSYGLAHARVCSRSPWLTLIVGIRLRSGRACSPLFALALVLLMGLCAWYTHYDHYLHSFVLVDTVPLHPLPVTHVISISILTHITLMQLT